VEALLRALRDRHLSAVPVAVLLQVLGDVLGPATHRLALLARAVLAAPAPELEGWTEVQPSPPQELQQAADSVGLLGELLLRFLPRAAAYPSFDRLWLRLLDLLGALLAEDDAVASLAALGLRRLLGALVDGGVIQSREGLALVTRESLLQMRGGPGLVEDLLGSL